MKNNKYQSLVIEAIVFDLSLFADVIIPENGGTNMHTTGSSNISVEFTKMQDEAFLRETKANLAYDKYAKRVNIAKRKGKTYEFFKKDRANPANTKKLEEGWTPDPSKLSITSFTANIEQYGDWQLFSDVTVDTSMHDLISVSRGTLSRQAAESYDIMTRNTLVAEAGKLYCGGRSGASAMTANDKITLAAIVKAVALLKADNIPPAVGGDYVMYIHPHVWHDLILDSDWQKFHVNNPSNMESGELGRIAGCRFIETTQTKITEDGGTSEIPLYHNIIVGSEAYALIDLANKGVEMKTVLPQASIADPLGQRASVGFKMWFGIAILDELAMYDVVCTSPEFAANVSAN